MEITPIHAVEGRGQYRQYITINLVIFSAKLIIQFVKILFGVVSSN